MKELVVKIAQINWGRIGPGGWICNEWEIYNDLTVEMKIRYKEKSIVKNAKLSRWEYSSILRKLKAARKKDEEVRAYDGSAWSIVQYEKGKEIWIRNEGYIYGIKPFEQLAKKLTKIIEE